jgi:P-type conjugative transfer protein TrbJ
MRKSMFTLTAAVLLLSPTVHSQIATFDASTFGQATITATNSVRQTLQQAQQYATQVQQYQTQLNQLANELKQSTGLSQAAQIWQQYQQVQQQLQSFSTGFMKGDLSNYLNQFQTYQYWQQVPPGSYPQANANFWANSSNDQKQADDAWVKGIQQQQQLLSQNAQALQQAQANANGAQGQMQAIQALAQVCGAMAAELQQIHALLLQQQTAAANRLQTDAGLEAMREAASQQVSTWTFNPSARIGY